MGKVYRYDGHCPFCAKDFVGKHGQKYCSKHCALKARRARTNECVGFAKLQLEDPEWNSRNGKRSQKGKHKQPTSILEVSKRTVSKICSRLGICCSRCGWDEESCDLHHIVPKRDGGTDDHSNLSYLCPNCHRLADRGKIARENLVTFADFVQDEWKDQYYG